MSENNRKPVDGWTPGEYGGYTRKNTDVDIDGEGLEVCESISGYEGYTSRTYISFELLNAVLAEKGMTVVECRDVEILQERVRQLEAELEGTPVCAGCGLQYGDSYPFEPSVRRRDDGRPRCNDCWRNA